MIRLEQLLRYLVAFLAGCTFFSANAKLPDLNGTWVGEVTCPVGPVHVTLDIKDDAGTVTYDGYGPNKKESTSVPVTLKHNWEDMRVGFIGPDRKADFAYFDAALRADGSMGSASGLSVKGKGCNYFSLKKKGDDSKNANALSLNTDEQAYKTFLTQIMEGNFASTQLGASDTDFNELFGSYLYSYAEQCAADPQKRPKNFVEMTNLQCTQRGVTTTYFRNGTFSESAPYCTQWRDVASGFFADPKMWETKKKLDAVYFNDAYKHIFSARKGLGLGMGFGAAVPNPKRIAELAAKRQQEMKALVKNNGCGSPALKRLEENLLLYANNEPFGIRPNGAIEPPLPIPAPGQKYEEPNYVALLEALIKGEARSWSVYKYVLNSIFDHTIVSRDAMGRPLDITAKYRFGGWDDIKTGTFRVIFKEGYPVCLYFWDKPNVCRSPRKIVIAQYVFGAFSLQNKPLPTPEEVALAEEKKRMEREQAAQNRTVRR